MATNRIQDGNVINHTLTADATSGELLVLGKLVGIAEKTGEAGETIAVSLTGVYEVPKTASVEFAVGDIAYAKSDGTVNATNTQPMAGHVVEAAGNGAPTVKIRLCSGK